VSSLTDALRAIAAAQLAEARIIVRQERAARARETSLDILANAFRRAAMAMDDRDARRQFELYAVLSDREARAASLQASVHHAEAERTRQQAKTTMVRITSAKAREQTVANRKRAGSH
jgi:hypothetical protein